MNASINIKQLEKLQQQAHVTSPVAQGLIEGYNTKEKKIRVRLLAALPIITPASVYIFRRIHKSQTKLLKFIKSHIITGDEEYDRLLTLYRRKEKFVQGINNISTISVDDYDVLYKGAPFILKPLLKYTFQYTKTNILLYEALGEKLCLQPKNVSKEQLTKATIDDKELQDFFDDDEDDYAEYAKMLSLRQSGHK